MALKPSITETLHQRVQKWVLKIKPLLFTYKKGFFEFQYLANSPQANIQCFIKMPFVKHIAHKQSLSTSNAFIKTDLFYYEVEEGLWLYLVQTDYKANVCYKEFYDKYLPTEYYFLNLEIKYSGGDSKHTFVNDVSYSNNSFLLFKPKSSFKSYHFKNTKEFSVTLFFNEDWLKSKLYKRPGFKNSTLWYFFESKDTSIISPSELNETSDIFQPIFEALFNEKATGILSSQVLQKFTGDFLSQFLVSYNHVPIGALNLGNNARQQVLAAEKKLTRDLFSSFPGIEKIANEIGISPTKLKANFKLVFEKSMFQYFREKQMLAAKEILKDEKIKTNDLSHMLGYKNAGKFAVAFKKHTGISPSEV